MALGETARRSSNRNLATSKWLFFITGITVVLDSVITGGAAVAHRTSMSSAFKSFAVKSLFITTEWNFIEKVQDHKWTRNKHGVSFFSDRRERSGAADEVYRLTSPLLPHFHAAVVQSKDGYYGSSKRREKL